MPRRYLYPLALAKPRFDELRGVYARDATTRGEYAAVFYEYLMNLEDWRSLVPEELRELLDEVSHLPAEVQSALRTIINKRQATEFAPFTALGQWMPENEQEERIPFYRCISGELIARLDSVATA